MSCVAGSTFFIATCTRRRKHVNISTILVLQAPMIWKRPSFSLPCFLSAWVLKTPNSSRKIIVLTDCSKRSIQGRSQQELSICSRQSARETRAVEIPLAARTSTRSDSISAAQTLHVLPFRGTQMRSRMLADFTSRGWQLCVYAQSLRADDRDELCHHIYIVY